MEKGKYITIRSGRKEILLDAGTVLYVQMTRNVASIHLLGGKVYEVRITLAELEKELGDSFIKVHRSCLVSVMAIHTIDDKIHLINGESLDYVVRRKKEIREQLYIRQKKIISGFQEDGIPRTKEEYHAYYRSFDEMPFAFADIEMIFNEDNHAVDWIFCYGNPALAKLEKVPLSKLIGSSFGSLFSNMDSKWLRSYERVALFREKLEIVGYSPEINTYLDIICFPTFKGHCGCILFDVSELKYAVDSSSFMSIRPKMVEYKL